jgi:hypothetical protein
MLSTDNQPITPVLPAVDPTAAPDDNPVVVRKSLPAVAPTSG